MDGRAVRAVHGMLQRTWDQRSPIISADAGAQLLSSLREACRQGTNSLPDIFRDQIAAGCQNFCRRPCKQRTPGSETGVTRISALFLCPSALPVGAGGILSISKIIAHLTTR